MRSNHTKKNSKLSLVLLAATMMSLTACEDSLPRPWAPTPVQASAEVKEWFKEREPLPEPVKEWLKAVGDEQEAIRANTH